MTAAQDALGKQLHVEAFDLSLQVLRSDSSREEAIPVLPRLADALGDPRRSEVAHGLLAGKDFTPDDRTFAWQVVCRSLAMEAPQRACLQIQNRTHRIKRWVRWVAL